MSYEKLESCSVCGGAKWVRVEGERPAVKFTPSGRWIGGMLAKPPGLRICPGTHDELPRR